MSEILRNMHEIAGDLHKAGVIDAAALQEMEALCVPPPTLSPADVKRIRALTRMSQPVFAALLNVSKSTIVQWERGAKRPSGASLRLLDLIDRKGVGAVL